MREKRIYLEHVLIRQNQKISENSFFNIISHSDTGHALTRHEEAQRRREVILMYLTFIVVHLIILGSNASSTGKSS